MGKRLYTLLLKRDITLTPSGDIVYQKHENQNFIIFNPKTGDQRDLFKDDSVGWPFKPTFSPDMKNLAIYWNRCLVCDGTERPYLGRGLWLLPIDNEIRVKVNLLIAKEND